MVFNARIFTCFYGLSIVSHVFNFGSLKAKKTEKKNEDFDKLHMILLIHVYDWLKSGLPLTQDIKIP